MAIIIDGLKIANEFSLAIRSRVKNLKKNGINPKLVTISLGEDDRDNSFSSRRNELAKFVEIDAKNYHFEAQTKLAELRGFIQELNEDKTVHVIFFRSSMLKYLSFRDVINLISPEKDVDGATTINQGRLFLGEPGMIPCTPLAVLHLLRTVHEDLAGKHAVVLGRSSSVGRPLTQLLLNANCTVTSLHSYSKDIKNVCKTADILVSAMGNPKFVTKEFVKNGATVIDIGINYITDEKGISQIVGDVDFDDVREVVGAITSVPHGVTPMSASYLMHNTLKLACCF